MTDLRCGIEANHIGIKDDGRIDSLLHVVGDHRKTHASISEIVVAHVTGT